MTTSDGAKVDSAPHLRTLPNQPNVVARPGMIRDEAQARSTLLSDLHPSEPIRLADRRAREFLTPRQFLAANPSVRRTKLYEDVRASRIPHVRLGRKVLIPADALDQIVSMPVDRDDLTAA